jgi:RimJ/RimL family protein N-acetyltransferase
LIVVQPREKLWAWFNDKLGIHWSEDFRAICLVQGGCFLGGVAYNGFVGKACFMHSAISDPRGVSRTFVRSIFEYPFEQLNLEVVLALVDSQNSHALDINSRLGFSEKMRLPRAGPDGDLIIMSMSRSECKWLKHGKEKRTCPA